MAEMMYAPEYSQENLQKLTGQYAQTLEPQYNRSMAQIANMLGGRGTLYGTPGSNNMQLLQSQKMTDIGKYLQGLQTTGLEAGRQERLTGEQRAYETPFNLANLLGTMQGTQGTYNPQTGWNWTGGPTQTLAGQAQQFGQTQMNPYQQAMVNATTNTQQMEMWKAIANLLGSGALAKVGGGISDLLGGFTS